VHRRGRDREDPAGRGTGRRGYGPRGQHAANGAGPGVYLGPVELQTGLAAAALGRLDAAVRDLEAAVSICDANGARGYAVQARGLTNKQIGETLFVSERTAENHVQHILVKLGFSNRSQIAAWSRDSRE
jgi:hypothetical protein